MYFINQINKMEVKALNNQHNYQQFLDAELFLSQQLTPPSTNEVFSFINRGQSEQLSRQKTNDINLRQIILEQLMREQQMNERNKKKLIFTRQNYSALSKKQRNIRKNNYHLTSNKSPSKEASMQTQHLQIKEVTFTRADSAQLKRPFSSFSQRHLRSSSAKGHPERRSSSRPQTSTRPQTSASALTKIQISQNTKKYFQFRKQNPLVIYPFESHLKIKRIDENPKILANIITKKNKFMEKQELYQYVSKIMQRRLQ